VPIALVSGGFTYFTALVKQALALIRSHLQSEPGGARLGTVEPPILGKEGQARDAAASPPARIADAMR
jgi:hypothetical protein